jgi:DNA-binding XRE family transcriptional regulator
MSYENQITDMATKVSLLGNRELTDEENSIIIWLENVKQDPDVVEAAKSIDVFNNYGPIFAACRRRARLTQEELAAMLHYESASTISKLENNYFSFDVELAIKWGNATKSKDAVISLAYGNIGMVAIINKLKSQGFWR